jgi:glycerophosphoryl diester phosphodiesterase
MFAKFKPHKFSPDFVPKLQCHRGYCQPEARIRENTLKAIQKSFELKYEMVEFDVRLTKDHKVILFHDDHYLDFKISKLTLSELRKKIQIDELSDVFKWYQSVSKAKKMKLNIEIKSKVISGKLEKAVYQLIQKYKMQSNILISSFNPVSLVHFKKMDPEIFRSLLLSFEKEHGNNFFIKNMTFNFLAQPNALHLREADWAPKKFDKLLKQKVPIVLWTCNDLEKSKKYFSEGISGLISDEITPDQI